MLKNLRSHFSSDFSWVPQENPPHQIPELAGKLLLKNELTLSEEQISNLLDQEVLKKISSIEHDVWGPRCRRCGNKQVHLFAKMPHTQCGKECMYCRACIMLGRVVECEPFYFGSPDVRWLEYEKPCSWTIPKYTEMGEVLRF